MTTPFSEDITPTDLEVELNSYMDPRQNNATNFQNGQRVSVATHGETREGVVVKQVDERTFLIKLDLSLKKTNPGKVWLKVSRDFAHQSVSAIY